MVNRIVSPLVLAALAATAAPASADIVEVTGKATLVDPHLTLDQTRLSSIGFDTVEGGSIAFHYSYDTEHPGSAGHDFFLTSYDAGGTFLDSLVLPTVGVNIKDLIDTDQYEGYADATVNTHATAVELLLIGPTTAFDSPPAVYLNDLIGWDLAELLIGVDIACSGGVSYCIALEANVTELHATVTPVVVDTDADDDGVDDADDQCAGTSSGGVTNGDGCTVDQLVPCAGPRAGGSWRNHGKYVAQLAKIAQEFYEAGLITEAEKDAMIAGAANSTCGK